MTPVPGPVVTPPPCANFKLCQERVAPASAASRNPETAAPKGRGHLPLGEVPRVGEDHEARSGDARSHSLPLANREQPVLASPEDERRNVDPRLEARRSAAGRPGSRPKRRAARARDRERTPRVVDRVLGDSRGTGVERWRSPKATEGRVESASASSPRTGDPQHANRPGIRTLGVAGATSTSAATRSGWLAATSIAMEPPSELPTRTTRRSRAHRETDEAPRASPATV